jgi:hypothetical protein
MPPIASPCAVMRSVSYDPPQSVQNATLTPEAFLRQNKYGVSRNSAEFRVLVTDTHVKK